MSNHLPERVPTIAAWADSHPYLTNLRATVEGDIRPLLDTPGYAPFAICREVLSYVDHLGHLFTGGEHVGPRSRDYMSQVMSQVDAEYATRAGELYAMYRCGSVHEFQPKVLKNSKAQELRWLCYVRPRQGTLALDDAEHPVQHLVPFNPTGDGKHYYLPVSTEALINDLDASFDVVLGLGPAADRVAAWNAAAARLNSPQPFEFVV